MVPEDFLFRAADPAGDRRSVAGKEANIFTAFRREGFDFKAAPRSQTVLPGVELVAKFIPFLKIHQTENMEPIIRELAAYL